MKIIVAGGGSVGRFTAEQLVAAGHDVVVVENDRAVVRNYGKEEEAKGVRWHLGDACDVEVLRYTKFSPAANASRTMSGILLAALHPIAFTPDKCALVNPLPSSSALLMTGTLEPRNGGHVCTISGG